MNGSSSVTIILFIKVHFCIFPFFPTYTVSDVVVVVEKARFFFVVALFSKVSTHINKL